MRDLKGQRKLLSVYVKKDLKRGPQFVDAKHAAKGVYLGNMCGAGTRVIAEFTVGINERHERIIQWAWGTLGTIPGT